MTTTTRSAPSGAPLRRRRARVDALGDLGGLDGERVALRGGWIRYWEHFLPTRDADRLFDVLRQTLHWEQFRNRLWTFPRLTAFVADAGLEYRYSGVRHTGSGWPAHLLDVRRRIERAAGAPFNGVLLNLYRDGNDSMGRHADAEPELGPNPLVASLSLGAVRAFVLRHNATREACALELAHGSLLVMGGSLQHHWTHALPKATQPVGARINLTFRNFRR